MKKSVKVFKSLLTSAGNTTKSTTVNTENIVAFEEKENQPQDNKKGLNAYNLFSAFTADIIKENTLFTR
jgi:hypothetical protein